MTSPVYHVNLKEEDNSFLQGIYSSFDSFRNEEKDNADLVSSNKPTNPNNNRGMTNQTDDKHIANLLEQFAGVI